MRLHSTKYMWHCLVFIFQQLQALDVSIVTRAGNERHIGLYCNDGLPQRLLRKDIVIEKYDHRGCYLQERPA